MRQDDEIKLFKALENLVFCLTACAVGAGLALFFLSAGCDEVAQYDDEICLATIHTCMATHPMDEELCSQVADPLGTYIEQWNQCHQYWRGVQCTCVTQYCSDDVEEFPDDYPIGTRRHMDDIECPALF